MFILCLSCLVFVIVDALLLYVCFFFFQAEDGIRDLVRSRGLGDVYKRQDFFFLFMFFVCLYKYNLRLKPTLIAVSIALVLYLCLLYTSDAADERSSVDLGGRRIIKKKKYNRYMGGTSNCAAHNLARIE